MRASWLVINEISRFSKLDLGVAYAWGKRKKKVEKCDRLRKSCREWGI